LLTSLAMAIGCPPGVAFITASAVIAKPTGERSTFGLCDARTSRTVTFDFSRGAALSKLTP
jgi:hypothetical protein